MVVAVDRSEAAYPRSGTTLFECPKESNACLPTCSLLDVNMDIRAVLQSYSHALSVLDKCLSPDERSQADASDATAGIPADAYICLW